MLQLEKLRNSIAIDVCRKAMKQHYSTVDITFSWVFGYIDQEIVP